MKKELKTNKMQDLPTSGSQDLGQIRCTNDALRRATRQLGHLYDETFASIGLKATQLGLIWQIEGLGGEGGPTLQTLADSLAIGISALTYALRPLIRDGLVELHPDAYDQRSKHAALTALGRKRLEEGAKLWAAANRRVEALLGPASAKMLRDLADQVASVEFSRAFKSDLNVEIGS